VYGAFLTPEAQTRSLHVIGTGNVELEDGGGDDDEQDERSPEFVEEEESAMWWSGGWCSGCDEVCLVWSRDC